jgi:hypothetical protein
MKKEYVLVGVGGMNGEIWNVEGEFDRLEDVIDWMVEKKMYVWDEGNEEECRVDMNWMEVISWMREKFMCDVYDELVDGKIVGVCGLSESLELLEIERA